MHSSLGLSKLLLKRECNKPCLFFPEKNEKIELDDLVDDFVTFYSAGK